MAYMNYMDLSVCYLRKDVKLNHSFVLVIRYLISSIFPLLVRWLLYIETEPMIIAVFFSIWPWQQGSSTLDSILTSEHFVRTFSTWQMCPRVSLTFMAQPNVKTFPLKLNSNSPCQPQICTWHNSSAVVTCTKLWLKEIGTFPRSWT